MNMRTVVVLLAIARTSLSIGGSLKNKKKLAYASWLIRAITKIRYLNL